MQPRLQDFADIRVGLTLRGRGAARKSPEAGPPLLRISDLSESGNIALGTPLCIDAESVGNQFRLQPGDIVVANRGSRATAALVPAGLDAVASGQLFFVRLRKPGLSAAYLHWFLNLDTTQRFLLARMKGSYVKNLSIAALRELEIPIPPPLIQGKVVALAKLAERERDLLGRIATRRQTYLEGVLKKAVNSSPPGSPSSQPPVPF